jgi:diacylglycerol kinase (ATP)
MAGRLLFLLTMVAFGSAMERLLLFVNPIAGHGRGDRTSALLRDSLSRAGYAVSVVGARDESIDWAGARAAVVIGGDGTLRQVVSRAVSDCPSLWHDGMQRVNCPPMLIAGGGTANLMARHLGVEWTPDDPGPIVAALRCKRVRWCDAAVINRSLFLLMTGVGFDAHVVHEVSRLRDGPIGKSIYAVAIFNALQSCRFQPIEVAVDFRRVFGPLPALAFVGNVAEYGAGFPMLPEARSDDGLLDVCVIPCDSPARLAELALLGPTGDHVSAEGVVYLKGRHVRIDAPTPVPMQVDGDAAGFTPAEISLLPARVPFIVPPDK